MLTRILLSQEQRPMLEIEETLVPDSPLTE